VSGTILKQDPPTMDHEMDKELHAPPPDDRPGGASIAGLVALFAGVLLLVLSIGSVTALAVKWASGGLVVNKDVHDTRTFTVSAHPQVVLRTGAADVRIEAGEPGKATVTSDDHAHGVLIHGTPEPMKMSYQQEGDVLTITAQRPDVGYVGSHTSLVTVRTPAASAVNVDAGSGDIRAGGVGGGGAVSLKAGSGNIVATDVNGAVTIETGSGDVALSGARVGPGSRASTASGNLTVSDVNGAMALSSGSGDIAITRLVATDPVSARTGSGNIRASEADAPLSAESGSGDVAFRQAKLHGRSSAVTGSGQVSFTGSLDQTGSYRFHSDSGGVGLTLAATVSFSLVTPRAEPERVRNDFGAAEVGPAPHPRLEVSLGDHDEAIRISRG
jgi:hypothetical protein